MTALQVEAGIGGMGEHPAAVRRRLIPDAAQVQIIFGSLLGGARIQGRSGERWLRLDASAERASYIEWKYERLATLSDSAPIVEGDRIGFCTIAHPLFDDLAALLPARRRVIVRHLTPLGLAVWLTDVGRLELRPEVFVPVAA
ncbi:MAG: hypothetical protein M3R54_09475 [Chloroflexota bacterium]|nr:hypothetical protein [Chloroflexota bacterium]